MLYFLFVALNAEHALSEKSLSELGIQLRRHKHVTYEHDRFKIC